MTLFRIPANQYAGKIAALAGARVSVSKEHYDSGRGVTRIEENGSIMKLKFCAKHWRVTADLDTYWGESGSDNEYFVCDKDVSHLVECKKLEEVKTFGGRGYPVLTLTTYDDFKTVGASFTLGEIVNERVNANSLVVMSALFHQGAEWIKNKGTGKVAAPAAPSLFSRSNEREVVTVEHSSFIREISYQPNYLMCNHTMALRFKDRKGAIIYKIDSRDVFVEFADYVNKGGSAGQYYNSFVKGLPVVENTAE